MRDSLRYPAPVWCGKERIRLNRIRQALIGNIVVLVMTVFGTAWIMSGIGSAGGPLDGPNLQSLKYYTVDSNILMGIAALAAAIAQRRVMTGKAAKVPLPVLLLKLAGTVSVTLTMLITIFFLGPTLGRIYGFFFLFAESSLFLHLLNPLAALFVFLRYERSRRIPFRLMPVAIIPTILYAIYYVLLTFHHIVNGAIEPGYDWYGFFAFGINAWWIVVTVILVITYGITLVLWRLNRGRNEPGTIPRRESKSRWSRRHRRV